jgi:hypothetical protein
MIIKFMDLNIYFENLGIGMTPYAKFENRL